MNNPIPVVYGDFGIKSKYLAGPSKLKPIIWQLTPIIIVIYGDKPRSSNIPKSGENPAYVRPSKLNMIPDKVLSDPNVSLKNGSSVGKNHATDISERIKITNGTDIAAVEKSLRYVVSTGLL